MKIINNPSPPPAQDVSLIFIFSVIGGLIGFLLRPAVPLLGQLPFMTVITDGSSLHGMGKIVLPYAQQSFNYIVAGTLIGITLGVVVTLLNSHLRKNKLNAQQKSTQDY